MLAGLGGGVLDDAVDQKDYRAVSVVTFDDGLKTFLTSGVPNLQFDIEFIIYLNDLRSKFDTYGGWVMYLQ